MEPTLYDFLKSHQVYDKNEKYTHTGLSHMKGKYYISNEDKDQFFSLYLKALVNGDCVCLTECHEKFSLHPRRSESRKRNTGNYDPKFEIRWRGNHPLSC